MPLSRSEGALIDFISPKRAERLFDGGRAKLVRQKKSVINRFIQQQDLDGGHRCWTLRPLSGDRSGTDLAPDALRPHFPGALCNGTAVVVKPAAAG
jgi:hypothetical protein